MAKVRLGRATIKDVMRFMTDCLKAVGCNQQPAEDMADLLLAADRFGHASHGLNRLGRWCSTLALFPGRIITHTTLLRVDKTVTWDLQVKLHSVSPRRLDGGKRERATGVRCRSRPKGCPPLRHTTDTWHAAVCHLVSRGYAERRLAILTF